MVVTFEANLTFESAVVQYFGPTMAACRLHLIVAMPCELDGIAFAAAMD